MIYKCHVIALDLSQLLSHGMPRQKVQRGWNKHGNDSGSGVFATRFWSPNLSAYTFLDKFKLFVAKSHWKYIRSRVKIVETDIAHWGLLGSLHFSDVFDRKTWSYWYLELSDTNQTYKCNWAWKTRTTIQKCIQWLRKGQRAGLVTHGLWYWNIFRILQAQRLLRNTLFCVACHNLIPQWNKKVISWIQL